MKEVTKYYVYVVGDGKVFYCVDKWGMDEDVNLMTVFNHEKSAKSRVSLWKNIVDEGGRFGRLRQYDEINYKEFKYFVPEPGIDF